MPSPVKQSGVRGSTCPTGCPHSTRDGILGALDLRGADGRLSHTKTIETASWAFGLVWDTYFILKGAPYSFLLAWTSLTFVAAYGLKGLGLWLKTRGGGTVDALSDEIQARRTAAGYDHEITD